MKAEYRKSFARDLKRIKDADLLRRVKEVIERVEQIDNLQQITNVKKLRSDGDYYRIRVGDYRLGLLMEGDILIFVRCLYRRNIYRYFP